MVGTVDAKMIYNIMMICFLILILQSLNTVGGMAHINPPVPTVPNMRHPIYRVTMKN